MSKSDLSRDEQNPYVGLYITKSGRITIDQPINRLCNWLMASTAGTIVYQDVYGKGDPQIIPVESGQWVPIIYDIILTSGVVYGNIENTTATGLFWGVSPREISKK